MREFSGTPAASILRSRRGFRAELRAPGRWGPGRPAPRGGARREAALRGGQAPRVPPGAAPSSLLPLPAHRHHPGTGEPGATAPLLALPAPSSDPRAYIAGGALSGGRTYTMAGGTNGARAIDHSELN